MLDTRILSCMVLLVATSAACVSVETGGDDNGTTNGTTMMSPQVDDDVSIPTMSMTSTSDLMEEAFEACLRTTDMAERQIASSCSHNATSMEIVDAFLAQHAEAVAARPLPGSGREAFAVAGINDTNTMIQQQFADVDLGDTINDVTVTLAAMQLVMEQLTRMMGQNQEELRATMYNLRLATHSIKEFSRTIEERPSSLVFERKPRARKVK